MTEITNDLGTFRGETEREALALARKAKRESIKREREHQSDRERALINAQSVGYSLLSLLLQGKAPCDNWELRLPNCQYGPQVDVLSERKFRITLDMETGRVSREFYGLRPVAFIENGSGFPIAMFAYCTGDSTEYAYAIGAYGSALELVSLPGFNRSMFQGVPCDTTT